MLKFQKRNIGHIRCTECHGKLGLGVRRRFAIYFCGPTCENKFDTNRRAAVGLVKLARSLRPG